ncbi:MAG: hypothetical protein JJU11_01550 [Candidatus Sumerlaeia bacterium]|nr:hypothetical protein [Candidatus Sumerlaeia bacterium]
MIYTPDNNRFDWRLWTPPILLGLLLFPMAILTYNHMGEDAFISFRYTRNLVAGHGLVYNPGEWVEGYSNLLWVLLLAPFEALGIRLHVAARFLSAGLHGVAVVAAWWLARKLLPNGAPRFLEWWLPLAIFFEPLLHYHTDRGLETVVWVTLQFLALVLVVAGRFPLLAGLVAACVVWTRPEGIGFALALLPAVAWSAVRNRPWPRADKATITHVLLYITPVILFLVAQLFFRKMAYGSLMPNTVVAKSGGMFASIREMIEFVCSHAFWPLLGIPGLLWGLLHQRTRVAAIGCLGLIAGGLVFRLMAGDLLNTGFRYLLPVMLPALVGYWMLVVHLSMLITGANIRSQGRLLVPVLATLMFLPVPVMPVVEGHGSYFRGNTNAPRSRLVNRLLEPTTYQVAERWNWFFADPVFINADVGRWVAENLPPDALIGADQIGQFGYHTNHVIVDVLGLTDAHVARHGLGMDYLAEREVDHLVIDTLLDIPIWPREWRMTPAVPALRDRFAMEDFQDRYRRRWLLRSHVSYIGNGFSVYISRELDDGLPMEEIFLGPGEEEFERLWRVSSPR